MVTVHYRFLIVGNGYVLGGATPNLGVQWNGVNGAKVCNASLHSDNINKVITDWSGVAQGAAGAWTINPDYAIESKGKTRQSYWWSRYAYLFSWEGLIFPH